MRDSSVWARLLGLADTVVESVRFEDDSGGGVIVVSVHPCRRVRARCGLCGRRSPGYDRGDGRRRWRALDAGRLRVFVEAAAPRVCCVEHGPTVAAVPWARHGVGHTFDFDALVAWLAVRVAKSAVVELMRVAWRTVGAIVCRVNADIDAEVDRLEGLARVGIDEVAYKRMFNYLTVVVDHDSGRLVWAAPGRDDATLGGFFDELGPERAGSLTHVSSDLAPWIRRVVTDRAPQATRCADAFHVVAWATDALDAERRRAWNNAAGRHHRPAGWTNNAVGAARDLKRCRWALWKNPDRLTVRQHHQLDWIARSDPALWRAYLLKEAMRYVFTVKGDEGKIALDRWTSRARRSRLPAFVELQRRIVRHRAAIDAALDTGLSNARAETTNRGIRDLVHIAHGFKDPDALIALAMLRFGAHPPQLPGRTHGSGRRSHIREGG